MNNEEQKIFWKEVLSPRRLFLARLLAYIYWKRERKYQQIAAIGGTGNGR